MMRFISISFFFFCHFFQVSAQCLNGFIYDDSEDPLAFASIYIKNNNEVIGGTISDYNGYFHICIQHPDEYLLTIEYVGKIKQELKIDFTRIDTEKEIKFILKDDPEVTILACPVITYNKTFEEAKVIFNSNEFEIMAGAYEDPARLIMKYPGYSNSNDQANGIINLGIAPAFTKWSLNGMEIVNPNHLSNAGTLSDLSAASSGGVNAISSNIMSRFAYMTNPNGPAFANALSAFADIQTSESFDNYVSIGLLGMETGWNFGSRSKGPSLNANYRYSFVGLLSSLGIDFGGESIAFQDLFLQTHLFPESSKHQFSFNYLFANNKNDHSPVTELSESTRFKDLTDIQFSGQIQALSINYNWKDWIKNGELNFQTSYSIKDDNREAFLSSIILDSFPGFYNYSIFEQRLLQMKFNSSLLIGPGKITSGIVYSYENQNQTLQKNIIQSFAMDVVQQHIRAFLSYNIENFNVYSTSIGLNFIHDLYTMENLIEPYFAYKKFLTSSFFARLSYEKSSQSPFLNHISMAGSLEAIRMKSHIFQLQIAHKWGFGVNVSGNLLFDLPHAEQLFYHGFNEFGFEEGIDLQYDGIARNYGISGYIQQQFGRNDGWSLQSNVSVFKAQYLWQMEWFEGKYDHDYAFNFSVSKSFGKINSKGWTGNINIAFHQRGGIYTNRINTKFSATDFYTRLDYSKPYKEKASAYQRIDFRIVLQKESKRKFIRRQLISMDIQNLLNKQNDGFLYYDQYMGEIQNQLQLGMIPVLSYKLIFGKE